MCREQQNFGLGADRTAIDMVLSGQNDTTQQFLRFLKINWCMNFYVHNEETIKFSNCLYRIHWPGQDEVISFDPKNKPFLIWFD